MPTPYLRHNYVCRENHPNAVKEENPRVKDCHWGKAQCPEDEKKGGNPPHERASHPV